MNFVWQPAVSTGLFFEQYQNTHGLCALGLHCKISHAMEMELFLDKLTLSHGRPVLTEALRLFQGRLYISKEIGEILGTKNVSGKSAHFNRNGR